MPSYARSPRPESCTSPTSRWPRPAACCATRKVRRLATEFACQWLHITTSSSSTKRASGISPRSRPARRDVRGVDPVLHRLFQHDGSVLNILDADYTFLNEALAKHYGIPGVNGPEWRQRRRRQEIRPRRHPRPGDDAGQAIGRLAHQPDPARQLDQRSPARREVAPAAEGRAAPARRRSGDRRPDRPAAGRETQPAIRSAPSATCGSTPTASALEALRRDRPPSREGPRRPAHRYPRQGHGRLASSTASTACETTCSPSAATRSCGNSAASCSATPWVGRCSSPTSRS